MRAGINNIREYPACESTACWLYGFSHTPSAQGVCIEAFMF